MTILIFEPNAQRLQESVTTLEPHYEVVGTGDDNVFMQQLPNSDAVILCEGINPDLVVEWIQQFPSTKFIVAMERKDVHLMREFVSLGVKECVKYPIPLGTVKRILGTQERTQAPINNETTRTINETAPNLQKIQQTRQKDEGSAAQDAIKRERTEELIRQPVNRRKPVMPWETKNSPQPQTVAKQEEEPRNRRAQAVDQPAQSKPTNSWDDDFRETSSHPMEYIAPTRQEIVAVTSSRGGVGKTTITYNIAAMAAKYGIKTVVIDADARGNMASVSHTRYRYTADDWSNVDKEDIKESLVFELLTKMECNAFLLPSGKESVIGITQDNMAKIIEVLRKYFQLILIDCEPRFTGATVTAYEYANKIIMVSPDDVSSFGRTVEKINQLIHDPEGLSLNPDKVQIVLNMVEKDFNKDAEALLIEKSGGCRIIAKVPHTAEIRKFKKQGRPAIINQKLQFTKQIHDVLDHCIYIPKSVADKATAKRNGWFGGLLKRA